MQVFEIENCEVREIDKVVRNFCDILEKFGNYVIVSGYVSIFCCRVRPTQDIDILFEPFSTESVKKLIKTLEERGYSVYFDEVQFFKYKEAFYVYTDYELEGYKIYFKIKPPKNEFHRIALTNRIKLKKGDIELYFSPIELQIAYKLWLGSDKDILDAKYLYDLFEEHLDVGELRKLARMLDVEDELEKIL